MLLHMSIMRHIGINHEDVANWNQEQEYWRFGEATLEVVAIS